MIIRIPTFATRSELRNLLTPPTPDQRLKCWEAKYHAGRTEEQVLECQIRGLKARAKFEQELRLKGLTCEGSAQANVFPIRSMKGLRS